MDYAFSIAKVSVDRLKLELSALPAVQSITKTTSVLTITFVEALSESDEAQLNNIVFAHSGKPLPPEVPLFSLDAPRDTDKKPVFTMSPATQGWLTWVTGRADKIPPDAGTTGRGLGDPICVAFSDQDPADTEKVIALQFLEPVEMHDGQLSWSPVAAFSHKDTFSFAALLSATVVTANPQNTGNCHRVPIAPGWNVIVPAAGNGNSDVDLARATPVPDASGKAYWDVDYATGNITASKSPGAAAYNLFDFDVRTYLLKDLPMGSPLGVFDVDAYKVECVHPSWKIEVRIKKHEPANCMVGGWLFTFRRFTT